MKRARRPILALQIWAALGTAVLLGAGCATGLGRGPAIDALHVFSAPVALDFDGVPGPDGFGLTLYASRASEFKGVPIRQGRLEIIMFDGALLADAKTNAQPRRTWTFSTADMKNHIIQSSLGTGYRFSPRWTDSPPLKDRITIVTRWVSGQTSVQSPPTTIAVTTK